MSSSAAHTTANLPLFRNLISEWELTQPPTRGFSSDVSLKYLDASSVGSQREGKDVIVAFRTRPPLEDEARNKFEGDAKLRFEDEMKGIAVNRGGGQEGQKPDGTQEETPNVPIVVDFCPGISVRSAEPGLMVAHVPGMKWSGPTLQHKSFESDLAFGPGVNNNEVYARTIVAHDMINLVLGGGVGCVLAYGQTGSHTMEALEHRIARDIFPAAEALSARFLKSQAGSVSAMSVSSENNTENSKNIFQFTVTVLELLGKHASDLTDTAEQHEQDVEGDFVRKEVQVMENKLGEVHPRLIETTVRTPEELQEVITRSLSHRRTSATHRNAASSRSHATLTIRVRNTQLPQADEGLLLLVDLAGSERYEDSKAHNKKRMEESRENNKSLMNLKECVRAKAKSAVHEEAFVHIPFRTNKLTLILKPIFDLEARHLSKTIVIAHVSPHLQDTAHSVNTLSYASPFKMSPPKPRGPEPYDKTDPRTWDHDQTVKWLEEEFKKRAIKRMEHARAEKAKVAKAIGKKLRPLDPDTPVTVQVTVDAKKLCPPPMTARNLARMYTSEWIEQCLLVRAEPESQEMKEGGTVTLARVDSEEVKKDAAVVYGNFNYLLLTARLRTRYEVMKTRKKLAVDAIYGVSPRETGWDVKHLELAKSESLPTNSDEDMAVLQMLYSKELSQFASKAVGKAKEEGKDAHFAREQAIVDMLKIYRDEVDKFKAIDAAVKAKNRLEVKEKAS